MSCDPLNNDAISIKYMKYEGERRAIIANFPSNIPLKHVDSMVASYLHDPESLFITKTRQRTLNCTSQENLLYTGQLFGESSNNSSTLCRHLVGVYNKKKKKLVLHDCHLISMRFKQSDENQEEKNLPIKQYNETRDQLIKAFGNIKGKRLISNREKSSIIKESIETSIDAAIVNSDDLGGKELKEKAGKDEGIIDYLPQFNPQASVDREVFPLSSLINDYEMESLFTPSVIFYKASEEEIEIWSKEKKYPKYILERLKTLPSDLEPRIKRSQILTYLYYLIFYFRLKSTDLRKKNPFPSEMPLPIKNKLLKKFSTDPAGLKKNRSMSPKQRDSVLFHILILSLIFDDFHLLLSDLSFDFPGKDLVKYYKLLGCKVVMQKPQSSSLSSPKISKYCATVSLPIPFVLPSPPKLKKRKK